MRFYRSEKYRVYLPKPKDADSAATAAVAGGGAKRKREGSIPAPGPRITFKQSKSSLDIPKADATPVQPAPPAPSLPQVPHPERKVTKLRIPNFIAMPPPAPISHTPTTTPSTPGGFKLKLKFGAQK